MDETLKKLADAQNQIAELQKRQTDLMNSLMNESAGQGQLNIAVGKATTDSSLNLGQSLINAGGPYSAAVSRPALFRFGAASEKELVGVKAELVSMARLALTLTTQDFGITDGIRSIKEQTQHVKDGTSRTMHSKHLDGLAIDATPFVNGKPTWSWALIYPVALAMDKAATQLGFAQHIRWGGAWDRRLADFGGNVNAYVSACQEYQKRHPGPDFVDGPHFEWAS